MNKSVYITTAQVNDPRNPGVVIDIELHEIEGGIIGIQPDYIDEVANYIANPYHDCQIVLLTGPTSAGLHPDPDLDEDELCGFLRIIAAVDTVVTKLDVDKRPAFMSGISKISGLPEDQVELLFGLAKKTVDDLALDQMTAALTDDDEEDE
jgi:hypothetical protein